MNLANTYAAAGISIVISGEAGSGIQTVEQTLTRAAKGAGLFAYAYSEFMSRIRGGNNSSLIRISSQRVRACVDRVDIFVPLDEQALARHTTRITDDTLFIADEALLSRLVAQGFSPPRQTIPLPLRGAANEAGGAIYEGTVILGVLGGLLDIPGEAAEGAVVAALSKLPPEKIQKNLSALQAGYGLSGMPSGIDVARFHMPTDPDITDEALIYGNDAVGIGALAGGCDFIASYPMSPGTGVLTFMAEHAATERIVVEQAEDEICAINMAIGAWYAGGRAMVTTSGGGFALMIEGISLAGAIESPVVVHLGQRPGPATGLPTRTEQADLNMVLHAGHGEFPRVILAPGSHEESIDLTRRAFDLADRFQVPAFVLTDQHLLDSTYPLDERALAEILPATLPAAAPEKHFVRTQADYLRYRLGSADGISPRGIPGFGDGLVCVDSDEHDEGGRITEDATVRRHMVDKRLAKLDGLRAQALPPVRIGPEDAHTVVVCWGSTLAAAKEAVESLDRATGGAETGNADDAAGLSSIALLHFPQLYPLHTSVTATLSRAPHRILVEGNATGQLGDLLTLQTGHRFHHRILKYDGFPFTVEALRSELAARLQAYAESGGTVAVAARAGVDADV